MEDNHSNFEWIEAYLANRLPPDERAAFEETVQTDPDFAAEVDLQRDTHQLVEVASVIDYKQELQRIDAEMEQMRRQPFFRHMTVRLAAMVLVLIAGVYALIFFQYNNQRVFDQAYSPYPDKYLYRGEAPAADSLMKAGMEAYSQQAYDLAIPLFQEVISQSPEKAGTWFYLGLSQLSAGDTQAALTSLEQAGQDNTWRENTSWYKALALLKDGQTPAAQQLLKKIADDKTNGYQKQADELLEKLNSVWRSVPGVG